MPLSHSLVALSLVRAAMLGGTATWIAEINAQAQKNDSTTTTIHNERRMTAWTGEMRRFVAAIITRAILDSLSRSFCIISNRRCCEQLIKRASTGYSNELEHMDRWPEHICSSWIYSFIKCSLCWTNLFRASSRSLVNSLARVPTHHFKSPRAFMASSLCFPNSHSAKIYAE